MSISKYCHKNNSCAFSYAFNTGEKNNPLQPSVVPYGLLLSISKICQPSLPVKTSQLGGDLTTVLNLVFSFISNSLSSQYKKEKEKSIFTLPEQDKQHGLSSNIQAINQVQNIALVFHM